MNDFTKRSEFEARTHELLHPFFTYSETDPRVIMVAGVFKAMWSRALKIEQIEKIASAVYGYDTVSLQDAASKLVRSKVLRRKGQLYEVNF